MAFNSTLGKTVNRDYVRQINQKVSGANAIYKRAVKLGATAAKGAVRGALGVVTQKAAQKKMESLRVPKESRQLRTGRR